MDIWTTCELTLGMVSMEMIFLDLAQSSSLFVTVDGHFGICQNVRPQDHVVLIAGCTRPMVIREAERNEDESMPKFRLVGEAFMSPELDEKLWQEDTLVEIALI